MVVVTDWDRFPGSLREACPTCGEYGYWASPAEDAEFTTPAGHTVHRLALEGLITYVDTCPKAR